MLKPKLQYFGNLNWLIWKDPDAGKDWGQEEKETTEDEMVWWHHRPNGPEFERALGDDEGQGSLVCCSPWGCQESDLVTEQRATAAKWERISSFLSRPFWLQWLCQPDSLSKTVFSWNSRRKGRNQFLLIQFNPQPCWSFSLFPLLPSHPLTLGWGTGEWGDGCRTALGNWRSVHPKCFCWKPTICQILF